MNKNKSISIFSLFIVICLIALGIFYLDNNNQKTDDSGNIVGDNHVINSQDQINDIIPESNQMQSEIVADPIQKYDRLSLSIKWGVIEDIKDNYILMRFYDDKTNDSDKSDDENDIAHDNTNDAKYDEVSDTKTYTKKIFYDKNTLVEIEYVPKNYPPKKLYTPKIIRSNNVFDLKPSDEVTIEFIGNFEDKKDLKAEIIHNVTKIPAEEFDKL